MPQDVSAGNDILQFAKSGIGRRLREADGKQRLWREQPFVLGIDARELYPEEEDGELDTGTGNYRCLF